MKKDAPFSEQEKQQRFNNLVHAALNTRPKPLKEMNKGMPSQSKKKKRKKVKKAA